MTSGTSAAHHGATGAAASPLPRARRTGSAPSHGPAPSVAAPEVRARLTEAVPVGVQVGLDSLGTPLADVEWVVVDLETTGIGASAAITEIGAVRVRGGRVVDEFQSLVNPGQVIPPRITTLTGITSQMVAGAPPIDVVYPRFAAWAGLEDPPGRGPDRPGPVLVAHNAAFDIGFLRRAAHRVGHDWSRPRVVDTLALARVALPRPLVPNHRLATLAGHFRAGPQERHRALGDARSTADVLRGLIDLLAPLGVATVEDVGTVGAPVPNRRRRRVEMADDLPRAPGVYRFVDAAGAPLYVGSATNLRSRVRSYFTASESRLRVRRMLDVASDVLVRPTSTLLEARVEELRAIQELHPMFNSASTHQQDTRWVVHRGGRLEVVPVLAQSQAPGALGPFRGLGHATRAVDALCATFPVEGAVALTGAGRVDGRRGDEADAALRGVDGTVVDELVERMSRASEDLDYEGAARWRELLAAYLSGLRRRADVLPVASARRLVWAHHRDDGGWVLHGASWGRLTHTMVTPPRTSPAPWVEAILADPPLPDPDVFLARTTWEEARLLTRSLDEDGARLVHVDGTVPLAQPVGSPLGRTRLLESLDVVRRA